MNRLGALAEVYAPRGALIPTVWLMCGCRFRVLFNVTKYSKVRETTEEGENDRAI